MSKSGLLQYREPLSHPRLDMRVGLGVTILIVGNLRPEAIRSAAAAEQDASVSRASEIVDGVVARRNALAVLPAYLRPLFRGERFGQ